MLTIGAISRLTIDILFTGLPHLPQPGEEVQASSISMGLGGGPLVTPVLLGRMGMPVKLGTFADDSLPSRYAVKLLEQQGCIQYENLYRGGWSPVTVSVVMPVSGDRSIVSYEQPPRMGDLKEMLSFFEGCDIALTPMLPELAAQMNRRGSKLVLDTTDFGEPPSEEYLSLLEIITPNRREAAAITGRKDPIEALRALTGAGVKHPLIKLGGEGCMILEGGVPVTIPPAAGLTSVDTTGAGDNFLAGLLYGYARGWEFFSCAAMANVFGGLSTTSVGVFGAELTQQKVLALYRRCYGPLPGEEKQCAVSL